MPARTFDGLEFPSGYVTTTSIRNGVAPSGADVRAAAADAVNRLLTRRRRNLFSHAVAPADTYAVDADTPTLRFRSATSSTGGTARITLALIPTAAHTATVPSCYWKISNASTGAILYDNGTSGTDSTVTFYGTKASAPASVVPDDFYQVAQRFSLPAGTSYHFELHQQGNVRVIGAGAYEELSSGIDLDTTPSGVDNTPFSLGQIITDTPLVDLFDGIDAAWEKLGAQHIAFTVEDATAPRTINGATEKNIIDGTSTWTATTSGFYIYPKYRHSDDTAAAGTDNAPVVVYCYAKVTAGTATVRFRTGSGASAYFGEINNISSTTGAWYATTSNINGGNTSDKVDITAIASSGTVSVYAAGCYDWRD